MKSDTHSLCHLILLPQVSTCEAHHGCFFKVVPVTFQWLDRFLCGVNMFFFAQKWKKNLSPWFYLTVSCHLRTLIKCVSRHIMKSLTDDHDYQALSMLQPMVRSNPNLPARKSGNVLQWHCSKEPFLKGSFKVLPELIWWLHYVTLHSRHLEQIPTFLLGNQVLFFLNRYHE